jgi:hypothetical protein
MLEVWEERKTNRQQAEGAADVLVTASAPLVDDLPEALRDFTNRHRR